MYIYTGEIPVPENVSACVIHRDNNTLFNVQWIVSIISSTQLINCIIIYFINRSNNRLVHPVHSTQYSFLPMMDLNFVLINSVETLKPVLLIY